MKKIIFLFYMFFSALFFPQGVPEIFSQQCNTLTSPNIDFESGSFSGWILESRMVGGGSFVSGMDPLQFEIQSGNGVDTCGGFPVVCSACGNYTARVGSLITDSPEPDDGKESRISYYLNVDSSNADFTFNYAVVIQDGSDSPLLNPNTVFSISNLAEDTLFFAMMNFAPSGFWVSPGNCSGYTKPTYYVPWSSFNVDLSNHVGRQLIIRLTTKDQDSYTGDAYAYINICTMPLSVGIDESYMNEKSIKINPNPNNGKFSVGGIKEKIELSIYNISGQKIYSKKTNSENTEIDLSDKPKGLYFLKLQHEENIYTTKIIIH